MRSHTARVRHGFERAARVLSGGLRILARLIRRRLGPEAQHDAHDIIALLLQQGRRDGAIHAPTHANDDARHGTRPPSCRNRRPTRHYMTDSATASTTLADCAGGACLLLWRSGDAVRMR